MRIRISEISSLVALAGSAVAVGAPPVKNLVNDADRSVVTYVQSGPGLQTRTGSLQTLDDVDSDGVREVLVTFPASSAGDGHAEVRSPVSGQTILTLASDTAATFALRMSASAVVTDDVDGDSVNDVFVSRDGGNRFVLRLHSGADGSLLSEFGATISEASGIGLSMASVEDRDDDGRRDVLLGQRASGLTLDAALLEWSPANGYVSQVIAGDPESSTTDDRGYTLVDLGVGLSGTREYLSTSMRRSAGPGQYFSVDRLGGEPLGRLWTVRAEEGNELGPIGAGAALVGDLTGDGVDEIVTTGQVIVEGAIGADGYPVYAMPVLDGATGALVGRHIPSFVSQMARGAAQPGVRPMKALIAVGDITGDGFADYAVIAELFGAPDVGEYDAVLVQSGRTGQTIAVFETDPVVSQAIANSAIATSSSLFDWQGSRDSLVSPGDVNGDGTPDLLVLVSAFNEMIEPPAFEQRLVTHYLPTPCVGDVDFDRVVNFADLNAVLSSFGAQDITRPADLNASGVVDFADLNLVLSAFGASCD
jgi:hypothetical protein